MSTTRDERPALATRAEARWNEVARVILDAEGNVVREGMIVRVLKDTTWLVAGEHVKATAAAMAGSSAETDGVYYLSTELSKSVLRSDNFVIDDTEGTRYQYEYAVLCNQRANIDESLAKLNEARAEVVQKLKELHV